MAEYKEPHNLFSFKYPANWEQRDPPNASVAVSFSDPEPHFQFLDNVNVGYRQLPSEPNVDDVVTASIASLGKQFEEFKLVDNSKVEVDGVPGRQLIYTGKRGPVQLEIHQVFVIDHRKFYTLAVGTSLERYDQMKPTIEKMMNSFRLGER